MCCVTCLVFALGIVFAMVQGGYGLTCWKCSSVHDVTCRDNFNLTKIEENRRYFNNSHFGNRQIQPVRTDPHEEPCDEMYTSAYNQKNVCLKIVYKGAHGIPDVIRGCWLVDRSFKVGECPEDRKDKNRNIEFCGTCESQMCNPADVLRINVVLAMAIPTVMVLVLGKQF